MSWLHTVFAATASDALSSKQYATSPLDAFTPEGVQDHEDLSSTWDQDPEHKWIYGNHPDMTAEQKERLRQMLEEEKGAFAYYG